MQRLLLLLVALFLAVSPPAHADGPAITDLSVIKLPLGVTEIPEMSPDARDGRIIRAWRPDGNAHGHDLYLVTLANKVVGVEHNKVLEETIGDLPYDYENPVKSVRFAWGKIGGEKHLLLITATRSIEKDYSAADPAMTVIDIYQLIGNGAIGTTGDYFTRLSETAPEKKYCNTDLALAQNLGLPLPEPYQGHNLDDGCL